MNLKTNTKEFLMGWKRMCSARTSCSGNGITTPCPAREWCGKPEQFANKDIDEIIETIQRWNERRMQETRTREFAVRLIDANALIAELNKNKIEYRADINEIISGMPVIDPEDLRGRGYNATERHPSDEFVCSECGFVLRDHVRYDPEDGNDDIVYEYNPKFCPECGAKMDKEGRNELFNN